MEPWRKPVNQKEKKDPKELRYWREQGTQRRAKEQTKELDK